MSGPPHRDAILAMTGGDLSALATQAAAFAVPFAICFALARGGQARAAWWLPGGILIITALFGGAALRLEGELPTGVGAAWSLAAVALPAVAGGALGILFGRRRT